MRWTFLNMVLLLATLAVVLAENEHRQKRDSVTITKVTNGKDCNKTKTTPTTQPPTVNQTPSAQSPYTSTLIARLQECLKLKEQQEAIQNAEAWMQSNQLYLPYQDVVVPPVKPPLLYSYTDEFGREVPFVLEEDAAGEYTASFGVPQPLFSVPEPVPIIPAIVSPVVPDVIVDPNPFYIDVPVQPVIAVTEDCNNGSTTEAPPKLSQLSVSPFYSYTQQSKDGSIITTANNGEVTITQTNVAMPPPPPYIVNRLQNIAHGATYGVAQLPALSNIVITKPNWSTVPLRITERNGAYSYTQIKKDGSQTYFNSGGSVNKPSTGTTSENKIRIPIVPPVEPVVVPNPTILDVPMPLYYSRPSKNSVRIPSGSYSYTQIHKDGSTSVQETSQHAGQNPTVVNKANVSKFNQPSQDKQTPYSYIQLNRGADQTYFSHPMNNAEPPSSGGYSYTQIHNDGSSFNHRISTITNASPGNMPVTSVQKNIQSSGGFSYTQIHSGTAPSNKGAFGGKVENKFTVPLNANKQTGNGKPVQAPSGSYSYTHIHKDGLTSVNGGSPSLASKPIRLEATPQQNAHTSTGFSYTQIYNGRKNKVQPATATTSIKSIPFKINSGSYSYTKIHNGEKNAATPYVQKDESTTAKAHYSKPLTGSGAYSFTQLHRDGSSSHIADSAAPNNRPSGISVTNGSIPPAPKLAPITPTDQPILSKYTYKQISHSNPNPNTFTIVNVEDKSLKTYSDGKFTNGVVPVPTMLEMAYAPEVSEIPIGYVYMPPATDVQLTKVPDTTNSFSFKNNPIVVEDVTPVQHFSYTQKKNDGSVVKVKAEDSHSVRVEQNKQKEPTRSRHRGDIPDSVEYN